MNNLLVLFIVFFTFSSCQEKAKIINSSSVHDKPSDNQIANTQNGLQRNEIAGKSFNQINKTFSSLTGVHPSLKVIRTENERVLASLPTGNNIGSYTGFNQIAQTALAFVYCREWINSNLVGERDFLEIFGVMKGFDATANSDYKNQFVTQLYQRLAHTDEQDDSFLQIARPLIVSVMNVSESDSIVYVNATTSTLRATAYTEEAILACGFFLSSAYFMFDGD